MLDYWLVGLGMMLLLEGIMPLLFPDIWRDAFQKPLILTDGQLRFMGLTGILAGLLLLYWIK